MIPKDAAGRLDVTKNNSCVLCILKLGGAGGRFGEYLGAECSNLPFVGESNRLISTKFTKPNAMSKSHNMMSSGLRMATSYTVFLSDNAVVSPRRRRKLMRGIDGDRDSEPEAELQMAPEFFNEGARMLFDSSAVIATKGCE